jgi:hypothetical protein
LYQTFSWSPERVGDCKKALEMIITKVGDVDEAIEFAKDVNDDELWDELIQRSLSRPGLACKDSFLFVFNTIKHPH